MDIKIIMISYYFFGTDIKKSMKNKNTQFK